MVGTVSPLRLLSGPPPGAHGEDLHAHRDRLGAPPWQAARSGALIDELEASGILGRGGAGFPMGRKWRSIADRSVADRSLAGRSSGSAVVVANGAEGEPRSHKDRLLMVHRPHLVLDGALLAAEAVGADEVIVYVGEEHDRAKASMQRAIAELLASAGSGQAGAGAVHGAAGRALPPIRLSEAPIGYVSGEASAAVSFINRGLALPSAPPRPSEQGVGGRPTLVQNVESLAYAALIARYGASWYRERGWYGARGTALVTVDGEADGCGVGEVDLGTTIGDLAADAGAPASRIRAVLVGGYFGTWAPAARVWDLPLDPEIMREAGLTFGCGMVSFLGTDACGVRVAADVIGFLARGSAGQCGPCTFGLAAIAGATANLVDGRAGAAELADIERWTGLVAGRGACHHPDGAAAFMSSALETFGDEFQQHARTGRCSIDARRVDGRPFAASVAS